MKYSRKNRSFRKNNGGGWWDDLKGKASGLSGSTSGWFKNPLASTAPDPTAPTQEMQSAPAAGGKRSRRTKRRKRQSRR